MAAQSFRFSVLAITLAWPPATACSPDTDSATERNSDANAGPGGNGAGNGSAGEGAAGAGGSAELAGPEYVELGTATSGETLFLDVEPGTLGFHVIVEDVDGTGRETVGIQVIRAPSGEYVNRDYVVQGAGFPTGSMPYGVIAGSVPQNPIAMPIETGQWAFLIAGFDTSGAQLTRPMRVAAYVQKTDDGEFHGGVLDLHVHLPKGIQIAWPDKLETIRGPLHRSHSQRERRSRENARGLGDVSGVTRRRRDRAHAGGGPP